MPKTFPIRLEVEEIALGTVLRRLHDMPGIIKLDLDLGLGGNGSGRKQLEQAALAQQDGRSSPNHNTVLQLLADGPKHIREISAAIGGKRSRAYGVMHWLKKEGLARPLGKGMHELTAQRGGGDGTAKAPRTKTGRLAQGAGQIILRAVLDKGPLTPSELHAMLATNGVAAKGISGVLARGKRDGIVKQNGAKLYELTAKGAKIEMGA